MRIRGYCIDEKIYHGPNSRVYRAHAEHHPERPVILKMPSREEGSPSDQARFRREHRILQMFTHPGVVRVLDFFEDSGRPVLVTEDFAGVSLRDLLLSRSLSPDRIVRIFHQVALILQEIHNQRVIHKDLSPNNIIIQGQEDQVRIIDFGIAAELRDGQKQLMPGTQPEGTLQYIAPEQTGRLNRPVDHRADLYSLGVCMYEALAGKAPFLANDPMAMVHLHLTREAVPLADLDQRLPPALSAITARLMAKNTDERYASAAGVAADLERCISMMAAGKTADFTPGDKDIPTSFRIPGRLYGREQACRQLTTAFECMMGGGNNLVVITGPSGAGKSSLVSELTVPVASHNGILSRGKCQSMQRLTPWFALLEALGQALDHQLRSPPEKVKRFSRELQRNLGPNGPLLTEILPGLRHLLPDTPPEESRHSTDEVIYRYRQALRQFLITLARPDQPLVIFLDDMQWVDQPTLKFLQDCLLSVNAGTVLWVLSYRDGDDRHPLAALADLPDQELPRPERIELMPLREADVIRLLRDAFHDRCADVAPLAALCMERTRGSPFFVNQLLNNLAGQSIIRFDSHQQRWTWDMDAALTHGITDNVADFLISKIDQLPRATRRLLDQAACTGPVIPLALLSPVAGRTPDLVMQDLMPAVAAGMLIPLSDHYQDQTTTPADLGVLLQFQHERIRESVMERIPAELSRSTHAAIAGAMLKSLPDPSVREEQIFSIVNHFLHAEDQLEVAAAEQGSLYRQAAQKAIHGSSPAAAARYARAGLQALQQNVGEQAKLRRGLTLILADVCRMLGRYDEMETLCRQVQKSSRNHREEAPVLAIQIAACMARRRPEEAIALALPWLKRMGVRLPRRPSTLRVAFALLLMEVRLLLCRTDRLEERPAMTDKRVLAVMEVMTRLLPNLYLVNPNLMVLFYLKQFRLSLRYGNTGTSAFTYSSYGAIIGHALGRIGRAKELGLAALRLVRKLAADEVKCRCFLVYHYFSSHFHSPLNKIIAPLRGNYHQGMQSGDLEMASVSLLAVCYGRFFCGDDLAATLNELRESLKKIRHTNQEAVANYVDILHQALLDLHEQIPDQGVLRGRAFHFDRMIPAMENSSDFTGLYYANALHGILSWHFGQNRAALAAFRRARRFKDNGLGAPMAPVLYFYEALARLDLLPESGLLTRLNSWRLALVNTLLLGYWGRHSPENYRHKHAILRGRIMLRLGLRQRAVAELARGGAAAAKAGFWQEVALAHELMGRCWLKEGEEGYLDFHIRRAMRTYENRGYHSKARYLLRTWSERLITERGSWNASQSQQNPSSGTGDRSTVGTSTSAFRQLDSGTFMKAASAMAREMDLEVLLRRLMELILENAGARYGVLLMSGEDGLRLRVKTHGQQGGIISVDEPVDLENCSFAPGEVLNYTLNRHSPLVLDKANQHEDFRHIPWIRANEVKSLACVPIMNSGELMGMIYLENNLLAGAFYGNRVQTIAMLAAQGAVSVKNARYMHEVRSKALLESQLRAAGEVQDALLPEALSIPGFDIRPYFLTADAIGGDWYRTFHDRQQQRLYVVIGDVTGHGISSAIITANVAGAVNATFHHVLQQDEPAAIPVVLRAMAAAAGRQVVETERRGGRLMTMVLAGIDLHTGETHYLNHGHPPVYRIGKDVIHPVLKAGSPLGLSHGKGGTARFTLAPGEMLLLYTDGLTENAGPDGKRLRLRQLLPRLREHKEAEAVARGIIDASLLTRGDNPAQDDCTFILIKRDEAEAPPGRAAG